MDRYISLNTRTMNSACSVSRSERIVGVAIMGVLALLHAQSLLVQGVVALGSEPRSRGRLRPGLSGPGREFVSLEPTQSLRPSGWLAVIYWSL